MALRRILQVNLLGSPRVAPHFFRASEPSRDTKDRKTVLTHAVVIVAEKRAIFSMKELHSTLCRYLQLITPPIFQKHFFLSERISRELQNNHLFLSSILRRPTTSHKKSLINLMIDGLFMITILLLILWWLSNYGGGIL